MKCTANQKGAHKNYPLNCPKRTDINSKTEMVRQEREREENREGEKEAEGDCLPN